VLHHRFIVAAALAVALVVVAVIAFVEIVRGL
jgi:hypothetical protein